MRNYISNFKKNLTDKNKEVINTFLIFLLLLPNFKLTIFTINGTFMDTFYNIGKILSAIFIIIFGFNYSIKNKYISKPFVIYFVLQSYIFINTTIQSGFVKDYFVSYVSYVIMIMIIDFFAHKNPKELIHALLILFELLILANFILMIIYPKGLPFPEHGEFVHLLGNRNNLINYFILALTFALILKEYGGSIIHFYALLPICIISAFIGNSTTGYIILFLFLFLYFTRLYKCKYITMTGTFVAYIAIFFLVVIFKIQRYMEPIWNLFGKDASFTTRTGLWDNILNHMNDIPLYGYGLITDEEKIQIFGNTEGAHNCILEHIAEGGIIQLFIVILFIVIVIYQMKNVRHELPTRYFMLGIIPLLLRTLVESSQGPLDFLLFILLAHAVEFVNYKKLSNNQIGSVIQS